MAWDIVSVTASAAVANGGTLTYNYPALRSAGNYNGGYGHQAFAKGTMTMLNFPKDFSLTFNAGNITFTYLGTTPIPANSQVDLQLVYDGYLDQRPNQPNPWTNLRTVEMVPVTVDIGTPVAASATSIATAQAVAAAGNLTLNGSIVTSGVATLDVPRNVQVISSNAGDTTQTAAITGTDEFGVPMHQTVTFNGTTAVGTSKAFKTVTQIAISAALAGNASSGSANYFGLPVFLAQAGDIFRETMDGALATAGTTVAGSQTLPSATTGDVRGTYLPATAANGTHYYRLQIMVPDARYLGLTQF